MAALTALAAIGCGAGASHAATKSTALPSGPFLVNAADVRTAMADRGVHVRTFRRAGPAPGVIPRPLITYRLTTDAGTEARVLLFSSAQTALRARATAGANGALGENALEIIGARGADALAVRHAITHLPDCRGAGHCH